MSEFKALKFQIGKEEIVELAFDQPRKTPSKLYPGQTTIWYGIKPLIGGENGFNATESLSYIIEGLGLKKGDTVSIKKMQGDAFAFFTVNGKTKDDVDNMKVGFAPSTSTQPGTVTEFEKATASDKERLDILWNEYLKTQIPV